MLKNFKSISLTREVFMAGSVSMTRKVKNWKGIYNFEIDFKSFQVIDSRDSYGSDPSVTSIPLRAW